MNEIILILGILSAVSWYCVYSCIKQKKIYSKYGHEESGVVISWDKHLVDKGRYKEYYYDIDVLSERGEKYHITTADRSARKYKNRSDIVIIVPDLIKNENQDYFDELKYKESYGMLDKLESKKLEAYNMLDEAQQQLNKIVKENMVIIKNERKRIIEIVASVFVGIFFSSLLIFSLIAMFLEI